MLNLDIHKKSNQIQNLSIVAISDVHLGNIIRRSRLEKYVELINKQNPDIILIVGDLFDRNLDTVESQHMDSVLRLLKAKYGVYSVLGNHDYFKNVDRAIKYMTVSDIKLLRDTAVTIDNKFVLIGRDDFSNKHRKSLKSIISNVDKDLPMILLDHQPMTMAEAVENNIDLQISGHTHNGQIYPFSLLIAKFYELAYGYRKTGNTHFYVSSGLGLWGAPIRLGTQSEIVNINLRV
jgi:predicted MPP superfamily phosphohydrolase